MPAPDDTSGTPEKRKRNLTAEFLLVLLPTVFVLGVLALMHTYVHRRLLFGSLASSAFLIYLDPKHLTNRVRTLVIAQGSAICIGYFTPALIPPSYAGAAVAMVAIILVMLFFDAMHPPAVSTAVSFAFEKDAPRTAGLFALAMSLVVVLVLLQRGLLLLVRSYRQEEQN